MKDLEGRKGFSLVELIIVIAIMAILAAAIAPALIRYINKARKADDIAFADSFGTTFNAALNSDDRLYEFINYRISNEQNGKYIVIGYTGYGNGINFYTMEPGGVDADLYEYASEQLTAMIGDLIGMETKKIPLKFYMKNELDQWIIAMDRNYDVYVFVSGHFSYSSSWWIGDNNRVNGSNAGSGNNRRYSYQLWPDVDPKYNALNVPKDVLKDN